MLRVLAQLTTLAILALIGTGGVMLYRHQTRETAKIEKLEGEKLELENFVGRLTEQQRRAEIIVTDKSHDEKGRPTTSLLFVELDKNGKALAPKSFTVVGTKVHVSAQVVQFNGEFLKAGDALRGKSIALFTGIHGDAQAPADAAQIDPPGQIPLVYRDAEPKVTQFETGLWADFWKLLDDDALREKSGVSMAYGQQVFAPLETGHRYSVTIASNGGLGLISEPIPPLYLEALKQLAGR